MMKQNYIFRKPVISAAVCYGRIEVLEYMEKTRTIHDGPEKYWFCCEAAAAGQLTTLKWCREREYKYPWDKRTCISAALNGHLDILEYAIDEGCRCSKDDFFDDFKISARLQPRIIDWIRKNIRK